ncbi:MAG TPA: hypothetical protein DEA90_09215, partial [Opitutae bacterium]|nr:hypothetical protein [Opitutae bacterium]
MNSLSLHLSKQSKRYAFSAAALFIVLGWGTAAQAQSHAGHDHSEEAEHGESHEKHAEHDDEKKEAAGHAEEAEHDESHDEHEGHDDHDDEGDGHGDEAEHDHAEEKAHGESHEAHGDHDDHGEAGGHDEHEEEEEGGPVKLTSEVRNAFGILLDRAGPGTLHEEVVLPGEIGFNRKAIAFATPRYNGTVQKINAQLADRVKKGDVLAVLESVDTLRPFEVKAPFDGVIVSYDITPGQTVDAGTSLFTVADLSSVWADLQIYQKNFGQIKEGLQVRITGGHNLPTFRGVIDYV